MGKKFSSNNNLTFIAKNHLLQLEEISSYQLCKAITLPLLFSGEKRSLKQ